ncbi:MAG: efflux RND transporter periplasmic adaptor subunit [Rhodocyclaceae bacterium]|jgi:RND family efflux transporter MFP subunit|nr:efflux RND transporter periplasmic adaptor subunit [Rhodocyclaceae bacterium]
MNRPTIGLSGLILLLAGCGGGEESPPLASQAARPAVKLERAADVAIHPERSAPAAVVGKNEARLSAEVAARIRSLPADVGQVVRRGDVVARLDPRDAELSLERAEAALAQAGARHAQARVQLERARALREKNFYSAEALTLRETELAAATADLRAATAQRDTARHALDKHVLRAPFDAVVRSRTGQVGELAAPGGVLLTLVSAGELELAAQLQPRDAQSLATATTAVSPAPTFEYADRREAVELLRISPAVNRESRSIEARLRLAGTPPAAGTEGRLVWRDPRPHLPADLLVRRDGRYGVFVAEDGKARFHVLPQAQEGRPAPLDLQPDTQVVTQGRHALQDGAPLE